MQRDFHHGLLAVGEVVGSSAFHVLSTRVMREVAAGLIMLGAKSAREIAARGTIHYNSTLTNTIDGSACPP